MKKLVSLITIIALGMVMYFQTTNEANSQTMGSESVKCYSSYDICLFWGCWTIYFCGTECVTKNADYVSNPGTCQ